MATATVTVKFVNQPREGKKKGNIKTADGQQYGVWADKLSQFQPGKTYEIEYESEEWQGKTYHNVKKFKEVAGQTNASAAANVGSNDRAMFITGIVGRAMGSGQFPATEIKLLTLAAADAWADLQAYKPADMSSQEPPDGEPF